MLLSVLVVNFAVHCYAAVCMKSDPHWNLIIWMETCIFTMTCPPDPFLRLWKSVISSIHHNCNYFSQCR